ncbi:MAG: alanine racemase [Oscillospiraceae bacterium]|nr:alanine racemase [Oscillospiraceae bacterium]
MQETMRTWAEISLDNLEHNYRAIRAALPQGCRFLALMKADAYGHGAVAAARRLEECGADYFAVACLAEALELRRAGVKAPVLILGHTPEDYTPILIAENLTQTVTCLAKAVEYSAAAVKYGGTLRIHLKIDTGMSRLGYLVAGQHFEQGVENIVSSCTLPGLDAEGIYTHFAVSDEAGEEARDYTLRQLELFRSVIAAAQARGVSFRVRHCANSGGVLNYPEAAMDMVRPGLLLYGYGDGGRLGLKPCMRLMTHVSTIKIYDAHTKISYGGIYETETTTRVGVLPIGYADGLFRCLSNKCEFYTQGGFAPQIGRICMDMCMIDLSRLPQANVESTVEIFGPNASLDKLAAEAGTVPYELLCAVSKRVPRVYI